MPYIYALIALFCWSGSDLFSKMGSRPEDKQSHWKMVFVVGVVMGLHALLSLTVGAFEFDEIERTLKIVKVSFKMGDLLTYLPISALYISSMVLGYVGLRYIELSVSSPICNSSGALAAVLCLIFLPNQTLSPLEIVGIILVCVGVVALGFVQSYESEELKELRQKESNIKYTKSFIALLFPLLYLFLDALGTFADAYVLQSGINLLEENTALVAYELTFAFMALIAFIILLIKKEKVNFKADSRKGVAALFETVGQIAYVFALAANPVVSAPIISAYCVLSVVWSRIFLKEKLSPKHYLTIAITVAGIILLGVAEGLAEL